MGRKEGLSSVQTRRQGDRTAATTTKTNPTPVAAMKSSNPDRPNSPQSSSCRFPYPFSSHLLPRSSNPPPPPPESSPLPMSPPSLKPNAKLLSFVLKAVVMALFISLFFIFVGIAAVLLLHLLIAGRALRRPRRIALLPNSPSGLSPDDLQKLPCFDYGSPAVRASPADCPICLDGFREKESCRILPQCSHVFHARCIDEWLAKAPVCPVCRSVVSGAVGSRREIQIREEVIGVRLF
ncbi:hypothetical protein ACLOJK_002771 [Asimina triloba]